MEPQTRFRALRAQHNLDQASVAELLSISPSQYGKIERGDSQADPLKLRLLAGRYAVSIDYLLGLSNDPGTPADSSGSALPPPDPIREGVTLEYDRMDVFNRRLLYAIAVAIRQAQEQRQIK